MKKEEPESKPSVLSPELERKAREKADEIAHIAFTPPMPLKFNVGKVTKLLLEFAALAVQVEEKEEDLGNETLMPQGKTTRGDSGSTLGENLEKVVAELADPMAWNWMKGIGSERDAADMVLDLLARKGLIKQFDHQLGGRVWEINGRQYGRTEPPLQSTASTQPTEGASSAEGETLWLKFVNDCERFSKDFTLRNNSGVHRHFLHAVQGEKGVPNIDTQRLEAAISLIWAIHVKKEVHLGFERYSGLENHCIPCICALALGASIDGAATAEEFNKELDKLRVPSPQPVDEFNPVGKT